MTVHKLYLQGQVLIRVAQMLPSQSEPRVHGTSRILGDVAVVHLIELRIIIKRSAINLEEGVVVSTYHTVSGSWKTYSI